VRGDKSSLASYGLQASGIEHPTFNIQHRTSNVIAGKDAGAPGELGVPDKAIRVNP
jgi:hypothetical protein